MLPIITPLLFRLSAMDEQGCSLLNWRFICSMTYDHTYVRGLTLLSSVHLGPPHTPREVFTTPYLISIYTHSLRPHLMIVREEKLDSTGRSVMR